MAFVADGLELVVQFAHALCGLDVDGVLFYVNSGRIPCDKTEQFDVFVKFFEEKSMLRTFFQVVQAETGEIVN